MKRIAAGRAHAAWFVALAVGAVWGGLHLRGTWWFYDEWSMIERAVHAPAWEGTTASFNGHLWAVQYWVFRALLGVGGLERHRLAAALFLAVLVCLHAATAAVFRAVGLRRWPALALGGFLTYLGAASQNWLFAIQIAPMMSIAAALAAMAIVLSGKPTPRRGAAVCGLLLLAVLSDSGSALSGVTMAGAAVALCWPRRWWAVLVPGGAVAAAWYLFADHGPEFPAGNGARIRFAVKLLTESVGASVGAGAVVGAVLLVVAVAGCVAAVRLGLLNGAARAALVGGGVATVVVLAALTWSRAGLEGFVIESFNRYTGNLMLPLVIAVAPAWTALIRHLAADRLGQRPLQVGAAVLGAAVFLAGLPALDRYHEGFLAMHAAVRARVGAAMIVVQDGCPSGEAPLPASLPAGDLSPQISTALLSELMARGYLEPFDDAVPDTDVQARMCG